MSKYKFNYAFVFYDVNVKRCNKVFKICKKYLIHYQKSVFRGEITPSNLLVLRQELKNTINIEQDFVCIIKFINGKMLEEEAFGDLSKETSDNLIL